MGGTFSPAILSKEHIQTAMIVETLTPAEVQVIRLFPTIVDNREIASRLCISYKTVQFHIGNIYSKLGLACRNKMLAYWTYANGLPVEERRALANELFVLPMADYPTPPSIDSVAFSPN
jgi:DNA-binding CsgD family transcriptional regulator